MEFNTKPKKGFTLIELLVVISIIALLLSILMPSLQKVKEQARKVVCQSNLKQQGVACVMYQGDYNSFFPTGVYGPRHDDQWNVLYGSWFWGGKTKAEWSYSDKMLLNPYMGTKSDITIVTGTSEATDSAQEVFHCPSDRGIANSSSLSWRWNGNEGKTCWDFMGFSYKFNAEANNNSLLGLWKRKATQVRSPYKVILAGDAGMMWTHYYQEDPFKISYWHNKKELGWGNAVFVDGHTGYIQVTNDNPDFQKGPDWTFTYNGKSEIP